MGGTAWDFSNTQRVARGELDLLVIDEAGQFSLASTIAVATGAQRLLLLGDPQQLPQVSQGAHPEAGGHVRARLGDGRRPRRAPGVRLLPRALLADAPARRGSGVEARLCREARLRPRYRAARGRGHRPGPPRGAAAATAATRPSRRRKQRRSCASSATSWAAPSTTTMRRAPCGH
ncbi:AAA domain-containing protein [Microbacterium sp. NRRL B-14842]|uniref:AAA domain-containing protein n=1 Tax=Microbacterium sp. NRRL B-14842 TaxID=3162881 RepID=UPI003D2AA755